MHDAGAAGQVCLQAFGAGGRFAHPLKEQLDVWWVEGRLVFQQAQESDGGCRLEPIAILSVLVAVERGFAVAQMEAADAKSGEILVDGGGSPDDAQQDIGGSVVAESDGRVGQFAKGHVDVSVGVLVLQGAVSLGQDAVRFEKANRLIERQLAAFDEMQHGYHQRQFEDRLHGRARLGQQVAAKVSARQPAGDRHFALGFSGNRGDLPFQRLLAQQGSGSGQQADEKFLHQY